MRQAQNLMHEYNLSEQDAEFTNITEATTRGAPNHAQTPPRYLVFLVEVIKRAFGVEAMFTWRYGKYGTPRRTITFYGPDNRPQIAAYAFDVLARQMTAARQEFISGLHRNTKPANRTARADQFCEGWASGVYHIVAELVPTDAEATLMAAYRQRQIDNGMQTGGAIRQAKKCAGSESAAALGYSAGRQARLNHGVNGEATAPQLIGGAS